MLIRILRVLMTLAVATIALVALVVVASQTPWVKNWARDYLVRSANRTLNGTLSIGRLGGSLFFGAELGDVTVEIDGRPVISIEEIGIDYSVIDIISQGIVIDDIRLQNPAVRLRRTDAGWNLGRLIKREEREAERQGPGRTVSIREIGIVGGTVRIDGAEVVGGVQLPERVTNLNGRLAFQYEPVHFTVDIDHLSLSANSPTFHLTDLSGVVAVRGGDTHIEDLSIRTRESALVVEGVVQTRQDTRQLGMKLQAPHFAFPEFGVLIPALAGIQVRPALALSIDGPIDRLSIGVDVESDAGRVQGDVVLDLAAPSRSVTGELQVQALDLRPWLRGAGEHSDLNGRAAFELDFAGPDGELRGTYRFAGPAVKYGQYTAQDIRAHGRIDGRRISFEADGRTLGAAVTAQGRVDRPARSGEPVIVSAAGSARGVDLRNVRSIVALPNLATDLSFDYSVRVAGGAAKGQFQFRRSTLEGAIFTPGTTASFSRQGTSLTYAAEGGVSDLNLQRIGRALALETLAADRFASRLAGEFNVQGSGTSLERLTLRASGTLVDSRMFGGGLPRAVYDVRIQNKSLTASAEGDFADLDLAPLAGRADLRGQVTGQMNVELALNGIGTDSGVQLASAGGSLNLRDSSIAGLQLDELAVVGRYAEDRVARLERLEASGPALDVSASGMLALDDHSSSDLAYKLRAGNLKPIGRLLSQPIAGALVVSGQVTGNLSTLMTEGEVHGSDVQYSDQFEALEVESRYALQVPELAFDRLRARGHVEAVFLRVAGRELNQLTADLTYVPGKLEFDATARQGPRTLSAAGDLVPHPGHREVHLTALSFAMEEIEWRSAPGGDIAIQYGADALVLNNVRLLSGDQRIAAEGRLGLQEGVRSNLVVQLSNVDVEPLERLLLDERQLAGRLHGNIRVLGQGGARVVEGEVAVDDGVVRGFEFLSLGSEFRYDRRGITLDARLQQTPQQWIDARGFLPATILQPGERAGHVPPTGGDAIDLRIRTSTIDLGFIQGLTAQVTEVTGTLQADVRVMGSGRDPHFSGYVEVRDGSFRVVPTDVAYFGLDTRLQLEPDRVSIGSLRIVDEHGRTLTVSGGLAFHERQIGAMDIKLVADGLELFDNRFGEADLDGTLQLTGELLRPRLRGEVEIARARLQVDEILREFGGRPYEVPATAPVAARTDAATRRHLPPDAAPADSGEESAHDGQPPADPEPTGPWNALDLDLQVRLPDTLLIRGTDLRARGAPIGLGDVNLTLGGNVRVRKEPGGELLLTGTVTTVRGAYEFQGRRFDILRDGEIRFLGLPEINPSLDVTAERVISGVVARVHITGSLRQPELALSSQPPLDQADILSLIVFNQPVNQLGAGQRVSLVQRAGSLASGFVVSPLVESLGDTLDVDLLEFQATVDGLGPRLTIGEQIGERLFVKFSQQFGSQDISEFVLEYRLAEFLRLQTAIAEGRGMANRSLTRRVERGGIDLIFFFSY